MSITGSYNVSTFSTDVQAEVKRLNAQIDLFWAKEIDLFLRLGLKDNLRIADLGCGTGYLIEKLLHQFPSSKFIGVEQDAHLVMLARDRLCQHKSVEEIFEGPINQFNKNNSGFDIIIMRLVLEHIPDSLDTLKHIRTLLVPNGRVIIIDNDFDLHIRTYPHISELDNLYQAYCTSRVKDQGDPCIGRRLPILLKQAGYTDIDLEILCSHNFLIGDSPFLAAEGGGIPAQLAKSGYLSEQTLQSLVVKWRDMLRSPDHVMFRQLFVATGCNGPDSASSSANMDSREDSVLDSVILTTNSDNYLNFVHTLVSKILNREVNAINDNQSLINAGLDSISATDIQLHIQQVYNVYISISEFLGGLNCKDIAELIEKRVAFSSKQLHDSSSQNLSSDIECGAV